jgi:hypothetical protein
VDGASASLCHRAGSTTDVERAEGLATSRTVFPLWVVTTHPAEETVPVRENRSERTSEANDARAHAVGAKPKRDSNHLEKKNKRI